MAETKDTTEKDEPAAKAALAQLLSDTEGLPLQEGEREMLDLLIASGARWRKDPSEQVHRGPSYGWAGEGNVVWHNAVLPFVSALPHVAARQPQESSGVGHPKINCLQ
jgi:hypothetical protein